MHPLVNIATKAAREAGKMVAHAIDSLDRITILEKTPNDFVTDIDRKAEQIIINNIRQNYPSHGILAEESGHQAGNDITWIIDPIDGTNNFVHGFPHVAISIGIMNKRTLEHGVIYDPLRQEMFTTSRGKGAQLNDRRIRVADRKTLDGALLGTGFPFKHKDQLKPYLESFEILFRQCQGIRRAGSAALDLAYVAAGRLDGFWELGLHKWDIAAGALLIKEAGGLIGDFTGTENYFESGNVVAGNPKIFKAILQAIHPLAHQFSALQRS